MVPIQSAEAIMFPTEFVHICNDRNMIQRRYHDRIVYQDSFNKAYRDEDSILDQTYQKQICLDFYCDDFYFYNIIRKCILTLE